MRHLILAFLSTFLVLSINTYANEVSDCTITPDALDISDYLPPEGEGDGPPEDVALKVYSGTRGTQYTVTCVADSEPAAVVLTGANMVSWNFDSETSEVTVELDFVGYLPGISFGSPQGLLDFPSIDPFGVAMVWAVEDPFLEDGPPAAMKGAWMATNVQQWDLIPPEDNNVQFGYRLSGPAGQTGFFHMYVPDTLLEWMSELKGQTIGVSDLAVFNDDKQASVSVNEVDGGALILLSVIFDSSSSVVQSSALSNQYLLRTNASIRANVTKKMSLKTKLPLSLTAKNSKIKKSRKFNLYGWLGNGLSKKAVYVKCQPPRSRKYSLSSLLKTKAGGYFSVALTARKVGTYSCRANFGKLKSAIQKVKVTK